MERSAPVVLSPTSFVDDDGSAGETAGIGTKQGSAGETAGSDTKQKGHGKNRTDQAGTR